MAELATADNPNFEVSRIEIDREGPSYTIDTLREFRSALGSDTKIYFITGLDAIVDVYTWNEFEPVSYTHLDVYKRQDRERAGNRHPAGPFP